MEMRQSIEKVMHRIIENIWKSSRKDKTSSFYGNHYLNHDNNDEEHNDSLHIFKKSDGKIRCSTRLLRNENFVAINNNSKKKKKKILRKKKSEKRKIDLNNQTKPLSLRISASQTSLSGFSLYYYALIFIILLSFPSTKFVINFQCSILGISDGDYPAGPHPTVDESNESVNTELSNKQKKRIDNVRDFQ